MTRLGRRRIHIAQLVIDEHIYAKVTGRHGVTWDEIMDIFQPPTVLWVTEHNVFGDRFLLFSGGLKAVIASTDVAGVYKVVTCYRVQQGS